MAPSSRSTRTSTSRSPGSLASTTGATAHSIRTTTPQAGLSGAQTANQMMGRGDFSAQILHYRTRGAYSVALFEPGVQGYTKTQEQQDVRDGWYGASDPVSYT